MPDEAPVTIASRSAIAFSSRFGEVAMHAGQDGVRDHAGELPLELLHEAGGDARGPALHRVPSGAGDLRGVGLSVVLSDRSVIHLRAIEELCFGRTGHEAGQGDAVVLQLFPYAPGERIEVGRGGILDRPKRTGHLARDRTGDEAATLALLAHLLGGSVQERGASGDVRMD